VGGWKGGEGWGGEEERRATKMSVSQPLPGQESLNVKVINILYKNPPYKMYYRYILNEIWVFTLILIL
jgi:hypothetical protein